MEKHRGAKCCKYCLTELVVPESLERGYCRGCNHDPCMNCLCGFGTHADVGYEVKCLFDATTFISSTGRIR